jgi:hypothetical protein
LGRHSARTDQEKIPDSHGQQGFLVHDASLTAAVPA